MGTLFVDRKGMELRNDGARLLLYQNGQLTGSVPMAHLERVVISASATVTSTLLGALVANDVGLVILNPRKRNHVVSLPGRRNNDAQRRIAQYRCTLDENWRAGFSQVLVRAKLAAQKRLLQGALLRRPDQRRALLKAVRNLAARLHALRTQEADRSRLRGIEGAGASAYFSGYCSLFPPALAFTGRNRRPPRDRVNACLSLAYTLLYAEATLQLHATGLDPMLGFYHDLAFARESLACDLVEPLRPTVDRWVWGLFRERRLRAEDFSFAGDACLLNKAGRKVFYQHWQALAGKLRRRLRHFARLTTRACDAMAFDSLTEQA